MLRMLGLATTLLFMSAAGVTAAPPHIDVRVDPRVELMSLIFRLAGHREYNMARVPGYAADVDAWFEPYRDHDVVRFARRLRGTNGIGYDAVMSMAIHVGDVQTLEPLVPFDAPDCSLESRWTPEAADRFLVAARAFVEESRFADFLREHADLYAHTTGDLRSLIETHADMAWFESYFGAAPTASFTVVAGLLNGPGNYGPKLVDGDGGESLYAIMGVWLLDDDGQPRFDESVLPTFVHEFCHSYVNHLVEAHTAELRSAGETMYPLVEAQMRSQAYGNWRTMFCESLVRASVVRYADLHDGPDAARQQATAEAQRGFLWVPDLARCLMRYEHSRAYASMAEYMPEIVAFFDRTAPTLAGTVAEREEKLAARRPHLVSMAPANGAHDVDPSTEDLVFTFDRPMEGGYSLMLGPEGQAAFPVVSGLEYDAEHTVLTVRVTLEPSKRYAFTLNGPAGGSFRSTDGVPLEMVEVGFTTRSQ